jgi:hypothetical protein
MSTTAQLAPTGLELPFLTDADPDVLGEGSLDPMGLARFADRLAEQLVPDMAARMQRVRFLTAAAAGAVALEGLDDVIPRDEVTPPSIALEWVVVEAFARSRSVSADALRGLPGIDKARAVVARQGHLDTRSYLRSPRVFGFFGVYKRLAVGIGLLDDRLLLTKKGDELVRAWEADRPGRRAGYSDRLRSTEGGRLGINLADAAKRTLRSGRVDLSETSFLWGKIVDAFRVDEIGPRERKMLRGGLEDPLKPHRPELITLLRRYDVVGTEADGLSAIAPHASKPLAVCLDAVEAFERVAILLVEAFAALRVVSTAEAWVSPADVSTHAAIRRCATRFPGALRRAEERLDAVGMAYEVFGHLQEMAEAESPADLVERLLAHHERVQAEKAPTRRSWFVRSERGFRVRPPYFMGEDRSIEGFVHPYRIDALRRFLEDLR